MGTVIQTRIDSAVKKNAESVLKRLGLSMNDAIRIFINQVVEDQGLSSVIIKRLRRIQKR